jgi:O-antigen/teichoic acid export membrane protein
LTLPRKDPLSTPVKDDPAPSGTPALPPVFGRLLSGTFWLALRVPLQVVFSFWSVRLILQTIGPIENGAYVFAWGFGFFQFLFEFGASSALQRQISDAWARGDHAGVNRSIACGVNFYAATALVQAAALLGIAYVALPYTSLQPASYPIVRKLLWLQAVTAPCFGFSVVISSVLQAARRYDFMPQFEVLITILRFAVLVVGLKSGLPFFWVIVTQTAVQITLALGPALWVMVRELGFVPHFHGARWVDYKALAHISLYMALIQISVVLADKLDTTVLGFVLADGAEAAISVYDVVSKPFLQLRQTGWMLAYMVMPAVASLAAARDERGLERIKYDGARMHTGVLLPVGLLAWIYAAPFLSLWLGDRQWAALRALRYDLADAASLMRLFLVAALPLSLAIPVQIAIGLNKMKVIALSVLAGALINLPISCYLTARLGVSGVIWGTVLTTLFSNLLVPGVYVYRVLKIDPRISLRRTLGAPLAGTAALIASTIVVGLLVAITFPGATRWERATRLVVHLSIATLAYIAGYALAPAGGTDLAELLLKIRRRFAG